MAPTTSLNTDEAAGRLARYDLYWGESRGDATTVTYAFRNSVPWNYESDPDSQEGESFSKFTATQIRQAELALKQISDVCRIEFQRAKAPGTDHPEYTNQATMLFGNYRSNDDGASAFASLPDDRRWASHDGDFWYNLWGDDSPGTNPSVPVGGFDFQTMVHELGHAVGLAHPAEYNAAAGAGTQPTYDRDAKYIQDSLQYSTMSYFDAAESGADHTINGVTYYARTMLLHDIAALQRLYGANMETRTGNSVYGFNANTGVIYQLDSNAEKFVICVWDAGGIDTLDFSGYSAAQTIRLTAESFSSVGGLKWNVSIAKGAIIENAKGGSGVDTIYGNAVANILSGNAGRDTLLGSLGNDTLKGGAEIDVLNGGGGLDTADMSDRAFDLYVQLNRSTKVTVFLNEFANDTLRYIENFIAGSGYDVLLGDTGVNRISGGAGDDVIRGNLGKDILDGGAGEHDEVNYGNNTSGVRVELGGNTWKTVLLSNDLIADDQIRNFEDIVSGTGNDTLIGNGLANILLSGDGMDSLVGGDGIDVLGGQAGADTLEGGAGADFFVFGGDRFSTADSAQLTLEDIGTDEVKDFSPTEDKVRLDHDTFTYWTGAGSVSAEEFGFGADPALMAPSNRLFYETDTGSLFYDADADHTVGSVVIATLAPGMLLTNGQFEII